MDREITEEIKTKFSAIAQNDLALQCFDRLSKCCFMNLVEPENNTKLLDQIFSKVNQQDHALIYEEFNIIMLVTIQCISKNLTDSEVTGMLADCGFQQQLIEGYIKKLNSFRQFIADPENVLVASRFESRISFKMLVDLGELASLFILQDWQQELIVSTKYANKVYQEVYKLQLHLKDDKTRDSTIGFKCTLPQLIEINNKLGVIVKNIENGSDLKHLKLDQQQ